MRLFPLFVMIASPVLPAQPEFEVASVKPNTSSEMNWSWGFNGGGGFKGTNIPLSALVTTAFRIRNFQVSRLARWAESAKYDVIAKGEGHPDSDQIMIMLQRLLTDRFKLAYHRTTKEAPIYALVPGKTGIRLQASSEPGCSMPNPDKSGPALCGSWSTYPNRLEAKGVTMVQLVAALTAELDRPVIDKTSYLGTFDVQIEFAPPELAAAATARSASPSIFTAIQERLGLRLDSQKGPVEIFVIDHIEKPDEN